MEVEKWKKLYDRLGNDLIHMEVISLRNPYNRLTPNQKFLIQDVVKNYISEGDLFFVIHIKDSLGVIDDFVYNCKYFDLTPENKYLLEETKILCSDCNTFINDRIYKLNGKSICEICHKNNYFICRKCYNMYEIKNKEEFLGVQYCKYCFDKHEIKKCKHCNKAFITSKPSLRLDSSFKRIRKTEEYCERCKRVNYDKLRYYFNNIEYKIALPPIQSNEEEEDFWRYGTSNDFIKQFKQKFSSIYWFSEELKAKKIVSKDFNRTFGIEFEVNANILRSISFEKFIREVKRTKISLKEYGIQDASLWYFLVLDYDGSLGDKGFEFKTVVLYGDIGIYIITKIVEILRKYFYTDNSCGLHLHLGIKDFSALDIRKAYYFYQRFQPNFKYYIDEKRFNNRYCRNITRKNKKELETLNSNLDVGNRYKAINFAEINEWGTLEFRIMEGTFDINKIIKWIKVNTKILNGIKNDTYIFINKWKMNSKIRNYLGKELYLDFVKRQMEDKEKEKFPMKIGKILNCMFDGGEHVSNTSN